VGRELVESTAAESAADDFQYVGGNGQVTRIGGNLRVKEKGEPEVRPHALITVSRYQRLVMGTGMSRAGMSR
jgi:hypothetical protein